MIFLKNIKYIKKFIIFIILATLIPGFIFIIESGKLNKSVKNNEKTQVVNQKRIQRVQNAGLTIEIPKEFTFFSQTQMNLTTNKPYAVNFYIQNYKSTISEIKTPYQLYAIYQWDTEKITKSDFEKSDFMLDGSSKKVFLIDNKPTISGVVKGERKRFITYILNNGHILTIAASETAKKHREITETIIQSIKFD